MTAIADLLTREARKQLLELPDEDAAVDRLMCQPGSLIAPAEPPPLHRAGRDAAERQAR